MNYSILQTQQISSQVQQTNSTVVYMVETLKIFLVKLLYQVFFTV